MNDMLRATIGGTCVGLAWTSAALIGWTFAGYPLVARGQAALRPRPVRSDDDHLPTVSVVVAAHNEAAVITDKLASVVAADYPAERLEILVVDDGSTDATAALVRAAALPGVRVLSQPVRGGKATAINRGVAAATGEIVVISDASALFDATALRNAVRLFADDAVGVVVGAIRVIDDETGVAQPAGLYWRLQHRLAQWESTTGSTVGVNGNFFALRRDTFTPLAPDTINDEFTLAMRQAAGGRRVVIGDGVVTYDRASASMSAEYTRRARITAGRFQWATGEVGRHHPLLFRLVSHKLLRAVVPVAFVGLLVASVVRAAGTRPSRRPGLVDLALLRDAGAWVWLGGQALFWGAGATGIAVERGRGHAPPALRVPAFLASTTVAGLAGLQRHVRRRQSVLWTTASEHSAPGPRPTPDGRSARLVGGRR